MTAALARRATALVLGLSLMASCVTLDDLANPGLGDLGPSEAGVRDLLERDRVREALEDARSLARRYRGARTQILLGRARWRNGELSPAERSFRGPAENGVPGAEAGLARVLSARGEWQRAVELARAAVESSQGEREARAVLASAAWWRRDAAAASRELREWGRLETGPDVPDALAAMAVAIDDLRGGALGIEGRAGTLNIDSGWGVEVGLDGRSLRFRLDPATGQTRVSPAVAASAGLVVRRGGRPEADSPPPALPIFSLEHAACAELRLAGTVVRNLVVGVAPVPEGFDGVLGADLLARLRWSLDTDAGLVAVGPADAGRTVERLVADREARVQAWLGARVVVHALGVQLLFHPRVGDAARPAELDPTSASALDLVAGDAGEEGGGEATDPALMLAGRRWEVAWERRSLEHRARGGAVAPQVILGRGARRGRGRAWMPETAQLRVDEAATVAPGRAPTPRRPADGTRPE